MIGKAGKGKGACPGEEHCPKYNSAANPDKVCEKCPSNYSKHKLSEIPGSEAVIPWVNHLMYLDGLHQVGCSFKLDDLSKDEWDGLLLLQNTRNEIEWEKYEKDRRKQQLEAATKTSVRHK